MIEKTFEKFGYSAGFFNGAAQDNFDNNNQKDVALRLEVYPIKGMTIAAVTYDAYQLESMMQELRRDGLVPLYPFQQMGERLIADSELRDLIINRRIAHDGNPYLREHMENAAAKLDAKEDRRIRIVKRAPERKVDLAVATSMMCKKILYLNV